MASLTLVAASQGPKLWFSYQKFVLEKQVSSIIEATRGFKGLSPTYDGASMSTFCSSTRKLLDGAECGAANDGKTSNPWGGDYVVSVGANKSRFTLQVTNIPAERIDEVADLLAPNTVNCLKASGCTDVAATSSSVTLTL